MLAHNYLNKIVIFKNKTGCIPQGTQAYCVGISNGYVFLYAKQPILGTNNIKVSIDMIKKNCTIRSH